MILKLDKVSKTFYNESGTKSRVILDHLDLQVSKGETIAIVGPSGSGKTTLLNLIGALDTPDEGQIHFGEQELNILNDKALATYRNTKIGFVFQQHHLLPQLTLTENILLPTLASKKLQGGSSLNRVHQLISRLGLSGVSNQKPAQLSGGECQRAAVARALINQPALILADEPTGALDHDTAFSLVDLLVELNKEERLTLIIVTHSPEIARKMDRVYTLENGKLVLSQ